MQIDDLSPNPAANAPQSASCNVVPPLTLLPLTLLYSMQTVDSNLDGNAKVPSVPAQRVITAYLMRLWPSHQYVLGDISLTRSEQTLGLQSFQRFKACSADPNDTISSLRPQRQPTRFTGEIWVIFSVRRSEHPFHCCVLTLSHTRNVLARNLCSISTGITCSLVRITLGPLLVMITS